MEKLKAGFEKLFKIQERGSSIKRELMAGLTTFLTMAYILAVNPNILSQTGMNIGGVFTATALSAAIACILMGFGANLPIALAPAMGSNAYFTFSVVLGMGYSWQLALTAVFLEGILFVILSFFNFREAIIKAIPNNFKKAVAVGIGLFITLIGLSNAGIVVSNAGTIISFAPLQGSALVAIIGIILTILLYALKVPGSILLGIFLTTLIGIPFGITKLPENFIPVSLPEAPIFCQFDFSNIFSLKFFTVFFTFFFVDLFDTVGTLVGVTTQAQLTNENGDIPKVKQALLADAVGTVTGAMLGTSTVSSYIESSAGVAAGGKTGFSSIIVALLFLLALFFGPIFLLIPAAATTPALVLVGFLMMQSITDIDFKDPTEGIPAFITIITMPFAYSIAEGIVWGLISYVLLNLVTRNFKKLTPMTYVLFVIFILHLVL